MIHVNVRGFLCRKYKEELQLVIQLRKREGEPEVYELPGGRIEEYERMTDALRREVMEETGLKVTAIHNEKQSIITKKNESKNAFSMENTFSVGSSFSMECIKPYCAYQTIEGPVDSFGVYFVCEVEGELQTIGDDTADVHWASLEEIRNLIEKHKFSEIDLPAMMMFLREEKIYKKY